MFQFLSERYPGEIALVVMMYILRLSVEVLALNKCLAKQLFQRPVPHNAILDEEQR